MLKNEKTWRGIGVAAAAALLMCAAMPASAQKYPDRPVKIVLPFGAGGVADVSSRIQPCVKSPDAFKCGFHISSSDVRFKTPS